MSQVVKLIQKLANTSSVRESYMKPLESFVKSHHDELMVRRLRVSGVRKGERGEGRGEQSEGGGERGGEGGAE